MRVVLACLLISTWFISVPVIVLLELQHLHLGWWGFVLGAGGYLAVRFIVWALLDK